MKQLIFTLTFLIISLNTFSQTDNQITRQEIKFKNGDFTIYGELLNPVSDKKNPALIFLVGSGPNSSHRTNYKDFLTKLFEEQFIDHDIAFLYFDKKGVGKSTGEWYKFDFYERAEDVKAAIEFLKTVPNIDTNRIGIVGHSQGGWIAQIASSTYPDDIKTMLSISGPTFNIKTQLVNDYQSEFFCKGIDSLKANKKAKRKASRTLRFVSILPLSENMKQIKLIKNFNPETNIKQIKCPSLFLFAENDELVYPDWCINNINQAFNGKIPHNFNIEVIPDVNHGLKIANKCYKGKWSDLEYSSLAKKIIKNWILENL